ncbi:MAG: sensor domain-containing diguanylate cyclase [Actinomycetota bacterium]
MGPTEDALPQALVDLAEVQDAVCLTFVDGATVDAPAALRQLFPCLGTDQGPLDGLNPNSHATAVALFEQARRHGHARGDVRVILDPARPYRLHVFDLESTLGCFAGIVAPASDSAQPAEKRAVSILTPRHMELRLNVTGIITAVDDATVRALRWAPDDLIGANSLDFIDDQDHDRSIAFWAELLEEPWSTRRLRQRWIRADGSQVWMETTETNVLNDPDLQCVLVELVDISDEMAAQTALAEREELLARLTDVLPIGVAQIDVTGAFVFSNRRWFEIADLSPDAHLADFVAMVDEDDRSTLRDAIAAARSAGESDVVIRTAGPQRRVLSVRLSGLSSTADEWGVVISVEDITERHRLQRQLVHQSERDGLTDLLNRKAIMERLERTIDAARSAGGRAAVAFIDLDGFKSVNDTYGHATGDDLLRSVAACIRDCVRDEDLVGRIGGDEFVVVVPNIPAPAFVGDLAARLEARIARLTIGDGGQTITASLGVAVLDSATTSAADLLALADRRMYRDKRSRQAERGPSPVG